MLDPEDLRELITTTENHIVFLQELNTSTNTTLTNLYEITKDRSEVEQSSVVTVLRRWIYSFSAKIRNSLEILQLHRYHLIKWEQDGWLGSEDW